jgi:hypothetical protein
VSAAAKIIQLVVVERELEELKQGLPMLPFTLEGWKAFDCVLVLENGTRYYIRLGGPSEPSYEEIAEKFTQAPDLFYKAA